MAARHRLIGMATAVATAATLLLLNANPASAAPSHRDLAERWAPIHFQDTDGSDADADYLSAVNFDGDWNTLNNWENQDNEVRRLRGIVYYSVVRTRTHWFILYGFFHPRDWSDSPDPGNVLEHENDMEGVLLTVRRDGSTFGRLQAMVTVAHRDFFSYVPAGSPFTGGQETVDGPVRMREYRGAAHPTTSQETQGHGAHAWNGEDFPGGDGVVYYPSGTAEVPANGNDRFVGYRLVNIFRPDGLWDRFRNVTVFQGDDGADDAANPPWGWRDHDDGLPGGTIARDPARLVATYFANEGTFARAYTRNRYNN
jgi:hypothetical protein